MFMFKIVLVIILFAYVNTKVAPSTSRDFPDKGKTSIIATLRWDNAFATFILFRRKISFSNPELFFHFARCTKDTLKCISMFFAFSNDIRKGGIFIDF